MKEPTREELFIILDNLYEQLKQNPYSEIIPADIWNLKRQLGIDEEQERKDLGIEINGYEGTITITK